MISPHILRRLATYLLPFLCAGFLLVSRSPAQGTTPQAITWTGATNEILALHTPYPIGATASSGLPVSLSLLTGPALLQNGTLTATNPGTIWLTAQQPGNVSYAAAKVARTFNMRPATMTSLDTSDTSGSALAVDIAGRYAYVADDNAGLQVIDISDPTAPAQVGGFDTVGVALSVQVVGNYAYIADGTAGIQILDSSDPIHLRRVGGYDTPGAAFHVQIVGNLAFVADYGEGLQVIDVSDPTTPKLLGSCKIDGAARHVRVRGEFANVAQEFAGLRIINIANPANPIQVGGNNARGYAIDSAGMSRFAYMASGSEGFQVIDLIDPTRPVQAGRGSGSNAGWGLHVVGSHAYVAGSPSLHVFDVSNPIQPIQIGEYSTGNYASGAKVVGDKVYLADGPGGLRIFSVQFGYLDLFSFAPPAETSITNRALTLPSVTDSGRAVHYTLLGGPAQLEGERLKFTSPGTVRLRATLLGNGVYLPMEKEWSIQVSGVAQTIAWTGTTGEILPLNQPHPLGALADSGLPVEVRVLSGPASLTEGNIAASAPGTIWIAAEQKGNELYAPARLARAFNLRPANLTLLASIYLSGSDLAVGLTEQNAYFAVGNAGLQILDLTDLTQPKFVGSHDTPGSASGLAVDGGYAYLAVFNSGLQIIDVTQPARPTFAGSFRTRGAARAVQAARDLAYVATSDGGLEIINVSDPSHPYLAGSLQISANARQITLSGTHAFVATFGSGLDVIDVNDPTRPVRVGGYGAGLYLFDVDVDAQYAYLATHDAGLQIVNVQNPARPFRVAEYSINGDSAGVDVDGGYAFLAHWGAGLQVIDVSNPEYPAHVGEIYSGPSAGAVQVVGNRVFVTDWNRTLSVFEFRLGYPNPLAFAPPAKIDITNQFIALPPTSANGAKVNYSVSEGPGRIEADRLILLQGGTVRLKASQPEDGVFLPVNQEWTVEILQLPESITWTGTTNELVPLNTPYEIGAFATSGLPVTITVPIGPAVITNGTLLATGPGTIWASAAQLGDPRYAPGRIWRSFNMRPASLLSVGAYYEKGVIHGLQVVSNIAYLAGGGGNLHVLDVSKPAYPRVLSKTLPVGYSWDLRIHDQRAYVAVGLSGRDGSGLGIFDVRNPASPVQMGKFVSNTPILGVDVRGSHAFLASGQIGLQVVDVSTPAAPTVVGAYDTPGLSLKVRVVGNFAYVADGISGLQIIDVSNPTSPRPIGAFDTPGEAYDIAVVGNRVYVADRDKGLQIIDVSDPAHPFHVGVLDTVGLATHVQVMGDHAYVLDHPVAYRGDSSLHVIDISNPESPSRVGGYYFRSESTGTVHVDGQRLYVDHAEAGLHIYEPRFGFPNPVGFNPPSILAITNTSLPLPPTSGNGAPVTFTVASGPARIEGDRLVITGLGTIHLIAAQPDDGVFLPVDTAWSIHVSRAQQAIAWTGTTNSILERGVPYAIGATASSGLPVSVHLESGPATFSNGTLVVTNPGTVHLRAEQPGDDTYFGTQVSRSFNIRQATFTRVGGYRTAQSATGVQVVGKIAYVTSGAGGLQILDVSAPEKPVLLGEFNTPGLANMVQIVGQHAFVADEGAGLRILDISDPAAPKPVGAYDPAGNVEQVSVSGDLAAVAQGNSGLRFISLKDLARPVEVGKWPSGHFIYEAHLDGNRAIAACGTGGVIVFDVSDPASPQVVKSYNRGNALSVQVSGNYLLAANLGKFISYEMASASSPLSVNIANLPGAGYYLDLLDRYAFVAAGSAGVHVVDLSNPMSPVTAGTFNTSRAARRLHAASDYLYVADESAGLLILKTVLGYSQSLQFSIPEVIRAQSFAITNLVTASSGLPVTLSVRSGPAAIIDGTLTFTNTGTVMIRVEQPGSDDYLPISTNRYIYITHPALQVRLSAGQPELFWPAGFPGYKLYRAESLAPGASWREVHEPPLATNGLLRLPLPLSEPTPQAYFRLFRP